MSDEVFQNFKRPPRKCLKEILIRWMSIDGLGITQLVCSVGLDVKTSKSVTA